MLDPLETREPAAREASQFECLRAQLSASTATAPGLARQLDGVDVEGVTDRAALACLPVLRKTALMEMQAAEPPLGGLATCAASGFTHLFQSPGPIYEPGRTDVEDWWRFARAVRAAGIGGADVVLNAFAYHLTPAGHMLESGALALGATVIAGGVGNSEAQARAAADLGATAYVGTPDFLKTLMEKAAEASRPLRITKALVSGGPLFPAVRQAYADAGIRCLQCYGTADLGLIAYETAGEDGPNPGMVVDEGVIVEIVRPGTGDPVPAGEVGEVLVTVLNADYPLLRFATGDMSAVLEGPSPCGRTAMRIKGWIGRADQTAKVRGMFVRPEQVAEIVARHPEAEKARITIGREGNRDTLAMAVEANADIAAAVTETARAVLKLGAEVETVALGSLPNDGKVIDDTRDFG